MTLRRCPACLGTSSEHLWAVSSEQAAQAFIRRESDPVAFTALAEHIKILWGGPEAEVVRCLNCGLIFAHPFVAGDEKFYNIAYPGTPGYPDDKWEFQLTLEDLGRQLDKPPADMRCLEIGAGVGNFLKRLPQIGFQKRNLMALELNQESLKILRQRGVEHCATDIRALPIGTVDYIFAFQVIEHMSDLDDAFSRFESLLSPGGAMFVAMPNPDRIAFNESNDSLLDMPPNHISRWTRTAIESLVARHGLMVRAFRTEPGRLLSFLLQDLKYHTLRRSMTAGTLASRVYGSRRSAKRKMLLAVVAGIYLVRRLPLWVSLRGRHKALGGSVWARIERPMAGETGQGSSLT